MNPRLILKYMSKQADRLRRETVDDGNFELFFIASMKQIYCTELNVKFTSWNNVNI